MPVMLYNLSHTTPVQVLRALTPEALEYQQSVEVENTWPGKIMYAIMLPHKAWAAGDTLVAVLRLSPLAKGGTVTSVITTLLETTEIHYSPHKLQHGGKKGVHQESRAVRRVKHEIVDGRAVRVNLVGTGIGANTTAGPSRPVSRPSSAMGHKTSRATFTPSRTDSSESVEGKFDEEVFENHDVLTYITFPIPHTVNAASAPGTPTNTGTGSHSPLPSHSSPSASTSTSPLTHPTSSRPPSPTLLSSSSSFPTITVTPSHGVEPVLVAHRIRWSIFIHNRDGHTSELGCTLPIHILDGRVLDEARTASLRSRRLALEGLCRGEDGGQEDPIGMRLGGGMELLDETARDIEDRELPSYTAHVRDRVANMYFPETATVRVPGGSGLDTVGADAVNPYEDEAHSRSSGSRSGRIALGHAAGPHYYHFPHASSTSASASPLDWVNSELLSLASSRLRDRTTSAGLDSPQQVPSHPHSRAPSPEREDGVGESHGAGQTNEHGHTQGHHARNLSKLFKATMRPFTALSHHGHAHEHHGERHGFPGLSRGPASAFDHREIHRHHSSHPSSSSSSRRPSPTRISSAPLSLSSSSSQLPRHLPHHTSLSPSESSPPNTLSTSNAASALLRHSLSEVPDYSVASRGFMGGVPPLSSSAGLPSYEEAARDRRGKPSERLQGMPFVRENGSESAEGTRNNTNTTLDKSASMKESPIRGRRETVSDTDLLRQFKRRMGTLQRIESRDSVQSSSEDEEEDERIEMRVKGRSGESAETGP